MKVFINPGHDRTYDSGAVNPNTGMREADVVAEIGERLKGYLEAVGIETEMLQSDNLYYDSNYSDRSIPVCEAANNSGADIFVSIHCNSVNRTARGTETFVYSWGGASTVLANCVQNQILNALGTIDRGIKVRNDLIVLKRTNMPAILVETAFIDNDSDAELLTNHRDDFAAAIARGITDFQNNRG
ncbi:N-acetylmuramoyl-L-alanine amidase family protein [Veillonella montpellierensis]|uniref:N-acetylmuramoyl-L-alanine amidase family protein n=1 Tax=Veillonella montpellierensis TaxID=187328 RepID=UPI0023F7629A|nr:N-acetylmuramoyl-L-alanine amidase [Veillonella montpellierensis]